MPKVDHTFVRKGDTLPRDKQGCKKGYYPERHLIDPDLLPRSDHAMFGGKAHKVKGGYVMPRYAMPLSAPVHRSKADGKLYSGVHHKWTSGSKAKKKGSNQLFDKASAMSKDDWTATGPGRHQWSKAERAHGVKSIGSPPSVSDKE